MVRSAVRICGANPPREKHDRCNGVWSPNSDVRGGARCVPDVRGMCAGHSRDGRRRPKKGIPFAPNHGSVVVMQTKTHDLAAHLRAKGPPRRSKLFRWLRGEYRTLATVLNGPEPDWIEAAAGVAAKGLVGANGKPPTPNALRQMWQRVRRDEEKEQAERLAKRIARGTPNRSPRQSAGRHEVAPAPHRGPAPVRAPEPAHHLPRATTQTVPSEQGAPASTPPKRLTIDDLPPEAKAQLDKLRAGLTDWDRRRHGI